MHEEGWYTDPYGRHEARWFSDGTPTKLVRDEGEESYDDPPDEPPTGTPQPIVAAPSSHGEDLYRADNGVADHEPLVTRIAEQAEFGVGGGSHAAMPNPHDQESC